MSFEVIGNLILVMYLFILKDKLVIDKKYLVLSIIYAIFLIPFYLISTNSFLLRFIIFIPRFIILVYGLKCYLLTLKQKQLELVLKIVFILHCLVILFCAAFPPINNFFNVALGKSFTSEYRISGLFSGYDFISFFTIIYLYVDFRVNNFTFSIGRIFKLVLGFSATVVTGRFGLLVYAIFFIFLFFRKITFSKILLFSIGAFVGFQIFYSRIMLFFSTFLMLRDEIKLEGPHHSNISIEDYGAEAQDGFYVLSPLVLLEESTRPFHKIGSYLVPNLLGDVVDSGPSFVILNIGFFLAILVYMLYFKVVLKDVKTPFLLSFFILIMDVKFRTVLVLMPTAWIVFNTHRLRHSIKS